ncbi:MAG: hypothetical protein MJ158_00710 [Alphaproteobacteria bacterium]|nr:hypothetical protein [Alphaproteobacteria bacterium]
MKYKYFVIVMAVLFCQADLLAAAKKKSGSSQSVVQNGTKIASATTNNLVDSECSDSFFGCMDAFCIVDNVSGGRCQCSSAFAPLNDTLNEIMKMDEESYAIATYGVDHIEMGEAADEVISASDKAFKKAIKDANDESVVEEKKSDTKNKKKGRVDLSAWNTTFSDDKDDEENEISFDDDDIFGKSGEDLRQSAQTMCLEQTPEKCKKSHDMLKMLYTQKIKSDCAAFENSLKQQKMASLEKLDTAKHAVVDAALTEYQESNKYDLGQCMVEFTKCMQTTAGCGEDWTGCVKLAAAENMKSNTSAVLAEQATIRGELSSITLAASTMDTMLSKKPICEHVTKQCMSVKDNVWDAFLKDIAPSLKTAELNAESDMRTSCLTNISQCYIKACKENMDPNDENGSYDMCLSRPENYKSFCKVELEPCLNATGGTYDSPDTSTLWAGVLAKLSAMRVDACTDEFKQCIQDKDRCGEDYSQCIGLDNEDVADICPAEKLTACYKEYNGQTESVRDTLIKVAQGILLNVDNNMLTTCQKAVEEAMVKVCGDSENCNNLILANGSGSRSMEIKYCEVTEDDEGKIHYTNCRDNVDAISDTELGKITLDINGGTNEHDRHYFTGVINGQIGWEYITLNENSTAMIDIDKYMTEMTKAYDMDDKTKAKVKTEIEDLTNSINIALDTLESDPKIQYCTTGRQVAGLNIGKKQQTIGHDGNARFPNLTQQSRLIIASAALKQAMKNYYTKYDEYSEEIAMETTRLAKRMQEVKLIKQMKDRLRVTLVFV